MNTRRHWTPERTEICIKQMFVRGWELSRGHAGNVASDGAQKERGVGILV